MPSIQFNKRILFSNNSKTQIIYFSEEEIPFGNDRKLVLGFKNSDHLNKRVNIQLNLKDHHIIEGGNFSSARKLKIVIGVSVAVVVFIIRLLFELCKLDIILKIYICLGKRKKISLPKPRRNNQATQNRAGNIEEQNPHTQIEIKLSKEYIDQYFPRNKFCDLKSSFPQSM